jgi:hypothetical protein
MTHGHRQMMNGPDSMAGTGKYVAAFAQTNSGTLTARPRCADR